MPENATHVIVASLEEPTAFSDSPRAPLPSMAMVTGDAVPSEDKFLFMFFKCLSKLQTSGTCQRAGLCPAPFLPPLHLALGRGHGGCPSPGSPAFCGQNNCKGSIVIALSGWLCPSFLCFVSWGVSVDGVKVLVQRARHGACLANP